MTGSAYRSIMTAGAVMPFLGFLMFVIMAATASGVLVIMTAAALFRFVLVIMAATASGMLVIMTAGAAGIVNVCFFFFHYFTSAC